MSHSQSFSNSRKSNQDYQELYSSVISNIPFSIANLVSSISKISDSEVQKMVADVLLMKFLIKTLKIMKKGLNPLTDFDFTNINDTEFKIGLIRLSPDKNLGSDGDDLKITFPTPVSIKRKSEFTNVMSFDLGIRDFVSFTIRKKGVGTSFEDNLPDINSSSDFILGHVTSPNTKNQPFV